MATQAVTSGASKNNGGTILGITSATTTTAGSAVTRTLQNNDLALSETPNIGYGSKVVALTGSKWKPGIQTAKGSGALAYQPKANDPQFLIRGYASKINNVASTLLTFPASDNNDRAPIHGHTETERIHITSIAYATGIATDGGNAGDNVSFNADNAATPTRAIPGEFVYLATPVFFSSTSNQFDYPAKTGG
jgi:hypothetical protein|tara:strand:- start:421 stop:996 length:576 start_codon:yes stop_codon:yes gene_type:complete